MSDEKTGTIGSRLRLERERLCLSQVEMAAKLGVTARTLRNYETGTRVPDADYLLSASKIGVSLLRVLHGEGSEEDLYKNAIALSIFEKIFVIKRGELARAIEIAGEDERVKGFNPEILFNEIKRISPIMRTIMERESRLDKELLEAILDGVEGFLQADELTLVPEKKAQVAAMLYRMFKASGKVDPAMIEEAIKLASG